MKYVDVLRKCEVCEEDVVQENRHPDIKDVVQYYYHKWKSLFICPKCLKRILPEKEEKM